MNCPNKICLNIFNQKKNKIQYRKKSEDIKSEEKRISENIPTNKI